MQIGPRVEQERVVTMTNTSRTGLMACALVLSLTGSALAGGLSQRSSATSSRLSGKATVASSDTGRVTINRQALWAPCMRQAPASLSRKASGDSTVGRAVRAVVGVEARGGSLAAAVGGFMARNETDELQARRVRQRWQNVTGYAVNAGRAVQRLGAAVRP